MGDSDPEREQKTGIKGTPTIRWGQGRKEEGVRRQKSQGRVLNMILGVRGNRWGG